MASVFQLFCRLLSAERIIRENKAGPSDLLTAFGDYFFPQLEIRDMIFACHRAHVFGSCAANTAQSAMVLGRVCVRPRALPAVCGHYEPQASRWHAFLVTEAANEKGRVEKYQHQSNSNSRWRTVHTQYRATRAYYWTRADPVCMALHDRLLFVHLVPLCPRSDVSFRLVSLGATTKK